MSTLFGIRNLLLALPVVAVLSAAAALASSSELDAPVVADVEASAAVASNCTYFSNASYTVVVGQFGYDCCNNQVAWGRKTAYKVCGGCFVCFPPPR